MNKLVVVIIFALYFILSINSYAYAYIDPGSISLVLQTILAAIAGLGATYRLWIFKVKNIFKKKTKKTKNKEI